MKQLTLLTIYLFFCVLSGHTQSQKIEHSTLLRGIRVVVLNLTGTTTIQSSHNNEVNIKSFLMIHGNTWGWRFPKKRPCFQVKERVSNDTLFLSSPDEFVPSVIGVSTYAETIDNIVQLPHDCLIIVNRAERLTVEDDFSHICINHSKKVEAGLHRSSVGSLKCAAQAGLKINCEPFSGNYDL